MDHKFAQQRSLPSKVLEKVNLPGRALEKWSPEVEEIMDRMRETDEKIREHAGELRNFVRWAKSYTRTRDYLNAALSMTAFHERIRIIADLLNKFVKSIDLKHYKFMLDQFEGTNKDQLFQYDPSKLAEACAQYDLLIKEAGAYDWAKHKFLDVSTYLSDVSRNLLTGKGHARRLMEKRFPSSVIKDMKRETGSMVANSERMLSFLLSIFNELESGVSRRNINRYKKFADLFIRRSNDYHKQFTAYYNKVVLPLKQKSQEIAEEEQAAAQSAAEQAKAEQERQEQARQTQEAENYTKRLNQEAEELEAKNRAGKQEKEPAATQIMPGQHPGETTFDYVDRMQKDFTDKFKQQEQNEVEKEKQKTLDELEKKHDASFNNDKLMKLSNLYFQKSGADPFDLKKKPEILETEPDPFKVKKEKPTELAALPQIELPEGEIDRALDEVPGLNSITPHNIIVSPATAEYVSNIFIQRLKELKQPITQTDFSRKLIAALKQAIFDGWVLSIADAQDTNHPQDKFINIYTRLKLNSIDPFIGGTARLKLVCRFSYSRNTLMLKSIQKHFTIGE